MIVVGVDGCEKWVTDWWYEPGFVGIDDVHEGIEANEVKVGDDTELKLPALIWGIDKRWGWSESTAFDLTATSPPVDVLGRPSFTVMDTCHASFFTLGLMGTIQLFLSSCLMGWWTVVMDNSSSGIRVLCAVIGDVVVAPPITGRISTFGEHSGWWAGWWCAGLGSSAWPWVRLEVAGFWWAGLGVVRWWAGLGWPGWEWVNTPLSWTNL